MRGGKMVKRNKTYTNDRLAERLKNTDFFGWLEWWVFGTRYGNAKGITARKGADK